MNATKTTTECTVRLGDKLHVFIGTSGDSQQLDAWLGQLRKSLKPNGDGLVFADGHREWIADREITDTSKSGSAVYTWKGDKVLAERCYFTSQPDGSIERRVLKQVWVSL